MGKGNPFLEVTVFTVIETVTMAGWLQATLTGHFLLGLVILFVGLEIEHIVAYNTGAGRAFFSLPKRG